MPRLVASPTTLSSGQNVTLTGACFAPNSNGTVVLTSNPVVLGTVAVSPAGTFSGTFTIPVSTPPGSHTLTVNGTNGSAAAKIQVVKSGGLSVTGGTLRALWIGLLFIGVGSILLLARRERVDWSYGGRRRW